MQVLSYLSLGSNLGNRRANLKKACELLKQSAGVKFIKSSAVYKTRPVGPVEQREFLNAAVKLKTVLSPTELLTLCKQIEKLMKRKKTVKWGPRIIDLDIVLFGNLNLKSKQLTIPHKEMEKRQFVLKPLIDIYGRGKHPVTGRTFKSMLKKLAGESKIRKVWTKI